MVNEDYCSYEIAELLKEKGFHVFTKSFYKKKDHVIHHNTCELAYYAHSKKIPAPTHQMAMKWLREVYDLHIISYPYRVNKEEKANHWCCQVYKSFNLLGYEKYTNETPKSYEEAIEIAIKYSLENLI